MALLDMKAIERRAADLVVAELGAVRWELRDTGMLGAQMRDYDVQRAARELFDLGIWHVSSYEH